MPPPDTPALPPDTPTPPPPFTATPTRPPTVVITDTPEAQPSLPTTGGALLWEGYGRIGVFAAVLVFLGIILIVVVGLFNSLESAG
ncbi:MAG: hypothetical protein ISS50_02125 [Anaerolineae bacterium]|nr:hypothetical protein [Anaerolineae bacterium]